MTTQVTTPFPIFTDSDGTPLQNGYIWIGEANLPPQTNPVAVYWDQGLTQPATQPIRTLNGYPVYLGSPAKIFVNEASSSILVQNKKAITVFSSQNVNGLGVGSDLINFTQAGTGAVTRTVQSKLRETVSVKDFGAVGDGVTDDTAAFQAAYNAVIANGTILIPPGNYLVNTITGTKNVLWSSQGALNAAGNAPLNLPGIVNTVFQNRNLIRKTITSGDDYSILNVQRDANHTGGTVGFVNTAIMGVSYVGPNVTNHEWAVLGKVDNYSPNGEQVGVYAQGWKYAGAGNTWGACLESRDVSNNPNPTTALVGVEVDVFANGTDSNGVRVGIDVVVGKGFIGGTKPTAKYGIRVGPQDGDVNNGNFKEGIFLYGDMETGLYVGSSGVYGIRVLGNNLIGLDLSLGTFTNAAIRLPTNSILSFTSSDTNILSYKTVLSGLGYSGDGGANFTHTLKNNGDMYFQGKLDMVGASNTSTTATAGVRTLPANPADFLIIKIDGTQYKIPYYNS